MSDRQTSVGRWRFDTGQLLPTNDSASIPLLRLLAATNDVMLLQKLVVIARDRADAANDFQKDILSGELGYFIRMLCGHLYEAGIAYRAIETHLRDQIDQLVGASAAARQAFGMLRKIYHDQSDGGFEKAVLGPIRNLAGFHYKEKSFLEGLAALKAPGELILSEHIGFTRYVLADDVLTAKTWEIMGGFGKYKETVATAFLLADELAIAVTHLLKYRLDREKIQLTESYGSVPIPHEILRTRDKIEADREKTKELS